MPSANAEPLLTVREVAERLAVSRTWVLRRIKAGDMPAYRLGGSGPIRLSWDEVRQWAIGNAGR